MADSSFDVVSEYDRQKVDNAVSQTAKEISQRYDFKGVSASTAFSDETITIAANSPGRVLAAYDILQTKFVRRGVSLKSFDVGDGEPEQSGKEYRLVGTLKRGLGQEDTKKLSRLMRDEGPKGVKMQIQGGELRVLSKSRDALQETISLLKDTDVNCTLQLQNYRWRLPDPSRAGRSIADELQDWNGHNRMRRRN